MAKDSRQVRGLTTRPPYVLNIPGHTDVQDLVASLGDPVDLESTSNDVTPNNISSPDLSLEVSTSTFLLHILSFYNSYIEQ